jgi:hypothetical protein
MDEELSRKSWAAVKDGKIAALGDDDNYPQDADELIDLKGSTVLPGLVDCHNHVPIAGLRLKSVDLADAGTIEEVLRRMEKACLNAKDGEYVYGSNYIPQAIAEVRYPTAEELDAICHGHLVFIIAAFSALRLAKFNIDSTQSEEFEGLPTPANALMLLSLAVLYASGKVALYQEHVLLIAVATSLLLVSPIRMFALKFKNFKFADNKLRFGFIVASLCFIIFFSAYSIVAIIVLYIVLSTLRWIFSSRGATKRE